MRINFVSIVAFFFLAAFPGSVANAQTKCMTTLDCAQQAVEAAARAGAAIDAIQKRLDSLEATTKAIGAGRILAIAQVKGGRLVTSSDGVSFNVSTRTVSFPNPNKLSRYVPVLSKSTDAPYVTQTVFVKSLGPDFVILADSAQDTGGRVFPADDFTLAIIAVENP